MAYPLTSIIILTKNNIQFTERCIFSIYEHINKRNTPYEILILDENSIDGTKEFCELHKANIQYFNVPELNSFGKRNNFGVSKAKGKYLWFLNNDTELQNDNLTFMLRHFENSEIGAVGSMHLFPDGSLNHIGMAITDDLQPVHIYPNENPSLPYINHGRYIDLLTHASIIFRRDVFEKVKGYTEEYSWGYEDVDLMMKIKESGFKAYCDNEAKMIHFGQSTYGRTDEDDKNRAVFMSKWKDKLVPNLSKIYEEKEEYLKNQKSFKQNIKRVAKGTLSKGINLIKGTSKSEEKKEIPFSKIYILKTRDFSAFKYIAERYEEVVDQPFQIIESIENLKAVKVPEGESSILLSTTHFFPDYLSSTPDWIRDYRTFDVNYERTDYSKSDYWIESLKRRENMTILASSEYCKDFLIKSGTDESKVFVVNHGYKPDITNYDFEGNYKNDNKIKILLIINTNDEARYGTDQLAKAFQIIRDKFPELADRIKLIIKNYGGAPTGYFFKTKEYLDLINAKIEIEYISKFLSEEELAKLYYQVDFFIAPFSGEGFGMKIIDAAAAGLPIVATDYGGPKDFLKHSVHIPISYTLERVGWSIDYFSLLQDETYMFARVKVDDLVEKIKYTIDNLKKLKEEALEKREYIREHFSWKKKWERIKEIDNAQLSKKIKVEENPIVLNGTTSTYKKLNEDEIKQTLIINTIRPENVAELLRHIEVNVGISTLKGEILVVDDATKEDPSSLLKEFDHLPLKYIKYAKWGGPGLSKEVGVQHAKGDNVIIIGDDIKPMPGFFKLHYNHYLEHSEPYTLLGHVEWDKDIRNNPVAEFATKFSEFQFGFETIRNQTIVPYTRIVTPNISFRKSDIVKAKQKFKTGFNFHEDLIWAKELAEKGFIHYYSRKAYGLHAHKLKDNETWLDWFTKRSIAIGKHFKAYTYDTSFDSFLKLKPVIASLGSIYGYNDYSVLKELAKNYYTYTSNLKQNYLDLEALEKNIGYLKSNREMMYKILDQLFNLSWVEGIAMGINENIDDDIAKALSFIYFSENFVRNEYARYRDIFEKSMGIVDTFRLFVFKGRQRYPAIFNLIYKLGLKVKK